MYVFDEEKCTFRDLESDFDIWTLNKQHISHVRISLQKAPPWEDEGGKRYEEDGLFRVAVGLSNKELLVFEKVLLKSNSVGETTTRLLP